MVNILVIPDAHAAPNQDLSRFTALGKLTQDLMHQLKGNLRVVCLGDFMEMGSLSSHNEGLASGMVHNYHDDIESGKEALDRYAEAAGDLPRQDFLIGNHEDPRLERLTDKHPWIKGSFNIREDLGLAQRGWKVHDFLSPLQISGVTFQHYFVSGTMGRPIGGINQARSMATKAMESCVAGHSHTLDFCRARRPSGSVVQTLSAGVFCDPNDPVFSWSKGRGNYWPGVVLLQGVENGDYDLTTISLDRLMKRYAS